MKYFNNNEKIYWWKISSTEYGIEFINFPKMKNFLKKEKLPLFYEASFQKEKTTAVVVSSLKKRDEIIKKIKALYK